MTVPDFYTNLPDFYTDLLYKGTSADFLQHHICLNASGVGMREIIWCRENCTGDWGWFFIPTHEYENYINPDRSIAYMAFDNTQDALKFKLIII